MTDRSENELLEIAHDRLLPYEYPKKPLLPGFKCLVLQADSMRLDSSGCRVRSELT